MPSAGPQKKLQLRFDEAQIASQRQISQLQTSLTQAQDAKRAAEQETLRVRAELKTEIQAAQARYDVSQDVAQDALAAARQREQALEARAAASDAQSAALLLQMKQKDEQVGELTRHLMALAQQNAATRGALEDNAAARAAQADADQRPG